MATEEEPRKIRCINCKRDIDEAKYELHESHCSRYIELCSSCGEPVPKSELESHYKEEHAPVPCDLCGKGISKEDLDDHKENDCPDVRIECKYCQLEIRRVDYLEHVDGCGSRTDFCEICNQRVMLRDMDEHKLAKCAHMKSEDSLDPLIFKQLQEEDQHEFIDSYGRFGDVVFIHHRMNDSHEPVFDHTYHHTQVQPSSPSHDCHEEDIHVDPQWLASVADVCGEEDLDHVLAQNLVVEDYGRKISSYPPNELHAQPEKRFSIEQGDRNDARQLLDSQYYHDQRITEPDRKSAGDLPHHYSPGAGMPQDSRFMYTQKTSSPSHSEARDKHIKPNERDFQLSRFDREERDALMARQIYERDLAYAQRNEGMKEVYTENSEERDALMARQIYERDLAYAQKNANSGRMNIGAGFYIEGNDTMIMHGRELENGSRDEERDALIARQIYERDLVYAQKNANSGRMNIGAGFYTEGNDTMIVHGRELENGSKDEDLDIDAEFARLIHENEVKEIERIERDKLLAKKLQAEEDLIGGYSSESHYNSGYSQQETAPLHLREDRSLSKMSVEESHWDVEAPYQGFDKFSPLRDHQPVLDSHPYKPSSFFPSSEDHLIPYYNPEQSYAEDHVLGGAELPTRSFSHNDSMGPCERCGELILIKDLVWHESKCHLRSKSKTNSAATTTIKPDPTYSNGRRGQTKTAATTTIKPDPTNSNGRRGQTKTAATTIIKPDPTNSNGRRGQIKTAATTTIKPDPTNSKVGHSQTNRKATKLAIKFPSKEVSSASNGRNTQSGQSKEVTTYKAHSSMRKTKGASTNMAESRNYSTAKGQSGVTAAVKWRSNVNPTSHSQVPSLSGRSKDLSTSSIQNDPKNHSVGRRMEHSAEKTLQGVNSTCKGSSTSIQNVPKKRFADSRPRERMDHLQGAGIHSQSVPVRSSVGARPTNRNKWNSSRQNPRYSRNGTASGKTTHGIQDERKQT